MVMLLGLKLGSVDVYGSFGEGLGFEEEGSRVFGGKLLVVCSATNERRATRSSS